MPIATSFQIGYSKKGAEAVTYLKRVLLTDLAAHDAYAVGSECNRKSS